MALDFYDLATSESPPVADSGTNAPIGNQSQQSTTPIPSQSQPIQQLDYYDLATSETQPIQQEQGSITQVTQPSDQTQQTQITQPAITQPQEEKVNKYGLTDNEMTKFQQTMREMNVLPTYEEFQKQNEAALITSGKALAETYQGLNQATIAGLVKLGVIDKSVYDKFTQMSDQDRKLFYQHFRRDYGETMGTKFADASTRVLLGLTIPGGGGIKAATTTGAMFGASEYVPGTAPEGQRLANIETGAGFGAGMGVLAKFVSGVGNYIKNFINLSSKQRNIFKAMDNFDGKQLSDIEIAKMFKVDKALVSKIRTLKDGLALMDRTGIDFKLSQLSTDVKHEYLESVARLGEKGERLARQIEVNQVIQSYKYWQRVKQKLFPVQSINNRLADPDNVKFGLSVKNTFDKLMGDLISQRANAATKDFALIDDLANQRPVIPLANFMKTVDELIAKNTMLGAGPKQRQLARELQRYREDFEIPSATGAEIQNLLSLYGAASKGKEDIFKALKEASSKKPYRDLYGALKSDLDNAANGNTEIAQALRSARDHYSLNSALIDDVRQSTIGALFGKTKPPKLEEIQDTFYKMGPRTIRETMDILKSADPTLQRQLQRFWLERELQGATRRGDRDVFGFIAGKMIDMKNNRAFKAVFNDAESRKLIEDGIQAARRVVVNNKRTGGKTVARMKEFSGVLASRDKTFLARLGSEVFTPKVISKAMLDPEGIKALNLLTKPFNANRGAAVITTLYNIMERDDYGYETQISSQPSPYLDVPPIYQ